jgi:hypothetical protein
MAHASGSSNSRTNSISPSDSISRQGSDPAASQLATRPECYPVEVLWCLGDCRGDPDVGLSASNLSRPQMERAVRHPDGSLITSNEWAAIKASARLIKAELLLLDPPRDQRTHSRRKAKAYFRKYFPKEWEAALLKLEMQQPLLHLCASHWKAEHVLGNTLVCQAKEEKLTNTSDSEGPVNVPSKRKRPTESHRSATRKGKRGKVQDNEEAERTNDGDSTVISNAGKVSAS